MINQSFIHIIYSKQDYENLLEFINNKESRNKYDILGGAIISGELKLDEKIGGQIGEKGKRSLVIIIQSEKLQIAEELISYGVIKTPYQVCPLEILDASELVYTPDGAIIKKAKYLSKEDFLWYLDEMEINNDLNNEKYQEEETIKSIGKRFMSSMSKIIILIYNHLNEQKSEKIKDLFNNANLLFKNIGLWIYRNADGRIIYPVLDRFLSITNTIDSDDFRHIINYVNDFGNDFLEFLSDQDWINPKYHEEPTFNQSKMALGTVMVLCSIGSAIDTFIMISCNNDVPLPFELMRTLMDSFDVFGRWLFASAKQSEVESLSANIQKALEFKHNKIFETAVLEVENSYRNLKKLFRA